MHYGSPSEKLQALCEIKAYFWLVFTQETHDFTRFVNDCGVKAGYCISEGEFASVTRLFFICHGRADIFKAHQNIFDLKKMLHLIFRSVCLGAAAFQASVDKSAGLLSWTRIMQRLFSKMAPNVGRDACSQRCDAAGSAAALAKCSQVLV